MSEPEKKNDVVLDATVEIVKSMTLKEHEVVGVITAVYGCLKGLHAGEINAVAEKPQLTPAISIKKSIQPDYIVCLEDGAKLKMMKRYIQARFNLTPEQYRERWGLPADYPMVAPNYAERRSELAKQIGLGKAGNVGRRTATATGKRKAA